MKLTALEKSVPPFNGIETFDAPPETASIQCVDDEVFARCPVTGRYDQYTVDIRYTKPAQVMETTSLKLYLQQFRDQGIFCEELAARVARDVKEKSRAQSVEVSAALMPADGIAVVATAKV